VIRGKQRPKGLAVYRVHEEEPLAEAGLSRRELVSLFEQVSNWGRWGPEDQHGALNLITDETRLRAAAAVVSGRAVPLGQPIRAVGEGRRNPMSHMLVGGDVAAEEGAFAASDYLGLAPHGPAYTHLDAFCHVFFDRRMYNGRPASLVATTGAKANDVTVASGLVSRGVLLDIPRLRGVDFLEPELPVLPSELDEAARATGVSVSEGDVLLIRVGRHARERAKPGSGTLNGRSWMPGLHPECLPWLHVRGVAVLGSDSASDALPTPHAVGMPVHVGALVFMGVHMVDNMLLDELAAECEASGRWTFLFSLGALNIPGGTASPVNPVAVL
jgi:kynurenine formamidase